jgi:hypothetical protein
LKQVASFAATFVLLGVVLALLHHLLLWLNSPDIVALLVFALPLVAYIAYTTQPTRALWLRSALSIYTGFAGVVLAATGLVYLIG